MPMIGQSFGQRFEPGSGAGGGVTTGSGSLTSEQVLFGNANGGIGQNSSFLFTGSQVLAPQGTTAAPGYSFVGDTNSGMYLETTDSIALVANGIKALTARTTGTADGVVTIPGSSAVLNFGSDVVFSRKGTPVLDIQVNSVPMVAVSTLGLGIGTTAPANRFTVGQGTTVMFTVDTTNRSVGINTTAPAAQDLLMNVNGIYQQRFGGAPTFRQRYAGGTTAAPTVTTVNAVFYQNVGEGWDGEAFVEGGSLFFRADDNWTTAARQTRFSINLGQSGSSAVVERLTLTSMGLGINTTAPAGPLQINQGTTAVLTVTTGNFVGIGTTAPLTPLVVSLGGALGMEVGLTGTTVNLQIYDRSGGTSYGTLRVLSEAFSVAPQEGGTETAISVHSTGTTAKIGFWTTGGSTKQTVTTITPGAVYSSADVAQVNRVIEALRAYGLFA